MSLRVKTLRENGLTHALKKAPGSKKRKKNAEKEADGQTTERAPKATDASSDEGKKRKARETKVEHQPAATNGIKNSATASLTRKVLEEQAEQNKRRKMAQNDNVKSLFSSRDATPRAGNSADYMTRGFSIGAKK